MLGLVSRSEKANWWSSRGGCHARQLRNWKLGSRVATDDEQVEFLKTTEHAMASIIIEASGGLAVPSTKS